MIGNVLHALAGIVYVNEYSPALPVDVASRHVLPASLFFTITLMVLPVHSVTLASVTSYVLHWTTSHVSTLLALLTVRCTQPPSWATTLRTYPVPRPSENVTSACFVEDAPSAMATRVEPKQSSEHTVHAVLKPPFSSVVTVQGSCSSPVEAVPSACRTTTETSSMASNPAPVMVAT